MGFVFWLTLISLHLMVTLHKVDDPIPFLTLCVTSLSSIDDIGFYQLYVH